MMSEAEMRETIRQMLADWQAATQQQRDAAMAAAADQAAGRE